MGGADTITVNDLTGTDVKQVNLDLSATPGSGQGDGVADNVIVNGTGPNGLPLVSVVLRSDQAKMQPYLDGIGAEIDFFDDWFGPYPLDRYGIAMSDSFSGLAMETLGRSLVQMATEL